MTHSRTDAPGGQAHQGHTENPAFGLGVTAEFTARVRLNQRKLRAGLKGQYDFIEGVSPENSTGGTAREVIVARCSQTAWLGELNAPVLAVGHDAGVNIT